MKKIQLLYVLLFIGLAVILFACIFYVMSNKVESFITNDINGPNYSHTVDQPINTTISCKNMCGPLARCSITGEQCTSDVDCYGCQKESEPSNIMFSSNIRGQNDAGKETTQVTPTYSTLTTDIGTHAKLYNKLLIDPPQYYQGENTWRKKFDNGEIFYDKRFYPGKQEFMPVYPERKTLSGQFKDDGPLAANAYL
uniref:Uncharacterized protein n=1 Tax=viral metagenome TaxID=1070528 RepID=A0A6C0LDL1_9ZZZZ